MLAACCLWVSQSRPVRSYDVTYYILPFADLECDYAGENLAALMPSCIGQGGKLAGKAYIGGSESWYPGWEDGFASGGTVTHESGHSFRLNHASFAGKEYGCVVSFCVFGALRSLIRRLGVALQGL